MAAAVALRWPATPSRLLTLAAVAVAVLDPWAPLAPGFWLSFGAVAVLVGTGAGARPRGMRARLRAALLGFGRTQMAVTLALTPLLAFLVRQVSLGSPLANALAIPVVSLAVTPLALLCGALSALPGRQGPAWLAGAAEPRVVRAADGTGGLDRACRVVRPGRGGGALALAGLGAGRGGMGPAGAGLAGAPLRLAVHAAAAGVAPRAAAARLLVKIQ